MKSNKFSLIEPVCLIVLSTTTLYLIGIGYTSIIVALFVSLFLLLGIGYSILQFSYFGSLLLKIIAAIGLSISVIAALSTVMVYLKDWQVTKVLIVLIWISLSLSLFRLSILYKNLHSMDS